MALTKTQAVIVGASGSPITQATSAAGSTYAAPSTGCQSTSQNISGAYEAGLQIRMTPGSGVTAGVTAQIDVGDANGNWTQLLSVASGTSATGYDEYIKIPDEASYVRITFFGNAGGSVGVQATLNQITAI